jgi:hypothetical protein
MKLIMCTHIDKRLLKRFLGNYGIINDHFSYDLKVEITLNVFQMIRPHNYKNCQS